MKRWIAVTLLIPKELAEGISNFLIENGSTGIEELDEDLKWERLKAYFPQEGKEKRFLSALHRYIESLKGIHPEVPDIQIETASIAEQDWSENWKRYFKPIRVTSNVVVRPPWFQTRLKKGQISIVITPGMAFGTGAHASTKLCIQALERRFDKKGISVLDVGIGSGILSIAAAKMGAKEVWGLDIDKVAVEIARENVRLNGVSDIVKIREGRIGDIQKRFDVVVANIDLNGLMRMRWPLLRHLKSTGFLILSGILEREEERLRQRYLETGFFECEKMIQMEGWTCLTLKKGR